MFRETYWSIFALLVLVSSCSKNAQLSGAPKERLVSYIEKSFSVKSIDDRDRLENYLTGDARTRLAAWSDEQFESVFLKKKRKFSKLRIREQKSISKTEVNITYELTYLDGVDGKSSKKAEGARVTNKKMCQMIQKDENWFIKGCQNIKQLVEYQNEMSLP